MCLGIIATVVTSKISRNGSNGVSSVSLTVSGSGAAASLIFARMARARGDSSMWNFMMENTTSSAVNGLPSCQVTPSCKWKV